VARGGIEPPTQGFSIICLSQLSLSLSISRAWVASFNLLKNFAVPAPVNHHSAYECSLKRYIY